MSEVLLNQAAAALQRNDAARAEELFRQVLRADPGNFEACDGLAVVLAQTNRPAEAAPAFEQALRFNPDDPITLSNYGAVLESLGRYTEALQQYDRALAFDPAFVDAIVNRAACLCVLGRHDEALTALDRVLAAIPNHLLSLYNRGVALAGLERFEEAVKSYDAALAIYPNYPEAWGNRGVALTKLSRFAEAVESFNRALRLMPNVPEALINLGGAQTGLKQFAQALLSYDRALALTPDNADGWFNRGVLLGELARIPEAIQSYEKALALYPGHDKAAYNKALCHLQLGEFEEGFRLYETRNRMKADPRPLHQPLWSGEDIAGKTLLVRGEQGMGDIIQFSRYLKLLHDKNIKVILSVQPALISLMQSLEPRTDVIAQDDTPPDFDWHIALESLPFALKTRLDTIPASIPYLKADAERVAKWKERLGSEGFKIGIAWRSSAFGASIGKTFSPGNFEALSKIPGVRLISLQKADEAGELKQLPPGMVVEELGVDFDAGPGAFLDSAAVMQSLDLVISSDTALAHLAGALGVPVWVALKQVPDWRWLLDRADSPWYPGMRLFRQPAHDDWAGLFAQMAGELSKTVR